jgi:hypothetical protein
MEVDTYYPSPFMEPKVSLPCSQEPAEIKAYYIVKDFLLVSFYVSFTQSVYRHTMGRLY